MRTIIYIIVVLIVAGCSASYPPETRIQERKLVIDVPSEEGMLEAYEIINEDDTSIVGTKIITTDTVVYIKYLPVEKKIYYKVKPDSVRITITDTIQTFRGHTDAEVKAEWKSGFKWGSSMTVLAIIALIAIVFYFRSKLGGILKLFKSSAE